MAHLFSDTYFLMTYIILFGVCGNADIDILKDVRTYTLINRSQNLQYIYYTKLVYIANGTAKFHEK